MTNILLDTFVGQPEYTAPESIFLQSRVRSAVQFGLPPLSFLGHHFGSGKRLVRAERRFLTFMTDRLCKWSSGLGRITSAALLFGTILWNPKMAQATVDYVPFEGER